MAARREARLLTGGGFTLPPPPPAAPPPPTETLLSGTAPLMAVERPYAVGLGSSAATAAAAHAVRMGLEGGIGDAFDDCQDVFDGMRSV